MMRRRTRQADGPGGNVLRGVASMFVLGFVALALALAPAAGAANPDVIHYTYSGAFTEADFCGTGTPVDVSYQGHGSAWLAPNQPVDGRNFSAGRDVLTNPENGATVIIRYAYAWTGTLVSGDPSGLHTVEWVFKGAAQVVRRAGGGVVSRDVGNLVVLATFDGDELTGTQIVLDRGGHPAWDGFCDVIVPELGLS